MTAPFSDQAALPEAKQHLARRRSSGLAADAARAWERGGASAPASQSISIPDLWSTLWRHRRAIVTFAAAVFLLTAIYTFSRTPLYEGVARLQIDPTRSSTLGFDDKPVPTDLDSRVKTEVAIIESDTVALQVMQALHLYADRNFAGKLATPGVSDPGQLGAGLRQKLLQRFDDSLVVKVVPNTQVVEIRFRGPDAALATATANSIIDEYMRRNFHTRVDGSSQVAQWLSRQMDDIRADTTAAQQKLADFQRQNNLLGTDESDNIVTDRLRQLNQELTQAEADRIVKEGRYRLANSGDPELIANVAPGTTAQVLRTQEADLRAQYAQLSSKFGHRYPKLRELRSQLGRLSSAIANETSNLETRLGNEYSAAAKAEAMIRSDFDKQKDEAYRLNEHVAQYAILKHQVESGQQLYDTLQLKLKEAGITSGLSSSYVSVVDRAQVPDQPVEPRRALYLVLGLGGGLLGGLMLGLGLDAFDDTIQGSASLEAVSALPELAAVPYLTGLSGARRKASGLALLSQGEFGPICFRHPNSAGAEAYRTLCSVLLLSAATSPPRVLVVTSAIPGEGKSTVSCNLATVLAQRGRRVLLVDADLRCSSLHTQLGMTHGPGLSNLLSTSHQPFTRLQPLDELPNLHLVPAGFRPAGPAEILASAKMQQLMAAWSADYDHVIVDTPPVLPFADALALAAGADGVILVARSGVSSTRLLLRVQDVLARSGANLLGLVLNAVRRPEYSYAYPSSYPPRTAPAGGSGKA